MDLLHALALGLNVAFTVEHLWYASAGAVLGTLIGVLPGLGPVAAIPLLLPFMHRVDASSALIMLAAVYCGSQYGHSSAAILTGMPGQRRSAVAAIEGGTLARQGRAGAAITTAALGFFFAGCVGAAGMAVLALPLTELTSTFGPADYFSLMVLALTCAAVLAPGSLVKAMAMIVLGMLLAQFHAGVFPIGTPASTAASPLATHGSAFVVIAIGVFALGPIIASLGRRIEPRELCATDVKAAWPERAEVRDGWLAVRRGTVLGALLGVLPGGARLASLLSYTVEKLRAGEGGRFGKGDIRGVAGPESARSAGVQTSFLPMLSWGIPTHAVMALMMAAMMLKGIQPGPQLISGEPSLFWGLIASMWAANVVLVILNLPLIGLWIKLATVPYRFVFPAVTLLCCIGAYALNGNAADVGTMAVFGVVGYVFYKLNCDAASLLLGFIVEPAMEDDLRRALLSSGGDWGVFMATPWSAGMLIAAALTALLVVLPGIRGRRERALQED